MGRRPADSNPWTGSLLSVESVDAFAAAHGADEAVVPLEKRKVRNGEHRMARRMIADAIDDAMNPLKPRACAEAREWLRDGLRLFSARVCFEALDVDYDAAMETLEARWAESDANGNGKAR